MDPSADLALEDEARAVAEAATTGAGTDTGDQEVAAADTEAAADTTVAAAPDDPEPTPEEALQGAAAGEDLAATGAGVSAESTLEDEQPAITGTETDAVERAASPTGEPQTVLGDAEPDGKDPATTATVASEVPSGIEQEQLADQTASSQTEQTADTTGAAAPEEPEAAPEEEVLSAAAVESPTTTGADLSAAPAPEDEARAETGTEAAAADRVTAPTDESKSTLADAEQAGEDAAATRTAASDAPSDIDQEQLAEEVAARVAEEVSDMSPSPDPVTVAGAAAEVAEELGLDVATLAQAVAEAVVEDQAQSFLAQLIEREQQAVEVDAADHFVTPDQVLSLLPEASFEITSREELLSDPDLEPHTPITVVREVEEIRIASPATIIASAGGDLEREIKVLEEDEVQVKTLEELLAELIESPGEMITLVSDVKYFDVTTPSEFAAQSEGASDEVLKIVKDRYTLEAASVAELLRRELDLPSDSIFYLRTVRPEDQQGIWGIVQDGLSGNFARGMAIRYGQSIDTYQVEIPEHADEVLPDQSSSFLGRLIHVKTNESYVYNFKHHRMGRNPDRVYPGQEIVIINFKPEELISIYKHFVEQRPAAG